MFLIGVIFLDRLMNQPASFHLTFLTNIYNANSTKQDTCPHSPIAMRLTIPPSICLQLLSFLMALLGLYLRYSDKKYSL